MARQRIGTRKDREHLYAAVTVQVDCVTFIKEIFLTLNFLRFFFLSLSIYRCLCVWVSLSLSGSPSGAVCVPLSLSGSPSGTVCVSPSFFRSLSLSDSSSLLLSLSLIHV